MISGSCNYDIMSLLQEVFFNLAFGVRVRKSMANISGQRLQGGG
jgi:hypothetical protein